MEKYISDVITLIKDSVNTTDTVDIVLGSVSLKQSLIDEMDSIVVNSYMDCKRYADLYIPCQREYLYVTIKKTERGEYECTMKDKNKSKHRKLKDIDKDMRGILLNRSIFHELLDISNNSDKVLELRKDFERMNRIYDLLDIHPFMLNTYEYQSYMGLPEIFEDSGVMKDMLGEVYRDMENIDDQQFYIFTFKSNSTLEGKVLYCVYTSDFILKNDYLMSHVLNFANNNLTDILVKSSVSVLVGDFDVFIYERGIESEQEVMELPMDTDEMEYYPPFERVYWFKNEIPMVENTI